MLLRMLFLVALLPYCGWLVGAYEFHFPDHVNLAIHEAGHLLFRPFGMTLHMLGGTLLQLLVPIVFAASFALRRQRFDAAVCVFWFAESLMYTAAYLGDAYLMKLPRVGGDLHDWNWMLSRLGLVGSCGTIATVVHVLASALAIGGLLVAGWVTLADRRGQPSPSGV